MTDIADLLGFMEFFVRLEISVFTHSGIKVMEGFSVTKGITINYSSVTL